MDTTCKICDGRGEFFVDSTINGRPGPPVHHPCECRLRREQAARLDAVWPGLGQVAPTGATNLAGWVRRDCVVTATIGDLRAHVARLLVDSERIWAGFDYVTDAELVTARFASGGDGEARLAAMTGGADLLALELGVRRAANKMLPDMILTAIETRQRSGQTTWIVVDPRYGLQPGLAYWSDDLGELLRALPQVKPATPEEPKVTPAEALAAAVRAAGGRLPRAEALALVGSPPAATFKRIVRAAGLQSVEEVPGSKLWVLIPQVTP